MNTTPAVIMNIQRQPGANIIAVVDRVKALLPQLKASLPAAIDVVVLTDRTTTIRASVADVEFELMLVIALVVMVIFLFLRTLAATIIPSVAVPLSLVGTFGVMYLLGYSLNNLTLMALTISTGFVVDDAIVMIENISRYIEEGEDPLQAALKGSEQIGFTILSLTVSLIAVLIPLLFMGDVVGRLFREFAVTLSVTILVSAAVSLTLTPMMCAKLLRHRAPEEESRFSRAAESVFRKIVDFYGRTLQWVLRHQTATLVVAVGTLVTTLLLYLVIPKGFFPVQDTGVILGISEASQTASFATMSDRQQALARAILEDPAVASLSSFIGVDGTNPTINSGRIQINLKRLEDRDASASEVIRRLQPRLAKVQGITLYMQPVQDLTVEDRVSRTQYQYSLEDADAAELAVWVPKLLAKLQAIPELRDVATDQQNAGLEAHLVLDRTTASRLGITPQQLDDALYDAFGQRQVSTIFTQLNQYRVVLEVDPEFQTHPDDLRTIYLKSAEGGSGSARRVHGRPHAQRAAHDQPPGAVPGRHDLVQPRAEGVAGRGRPRDRAGEGRARAAGEHPGVVPGDREGLRRVADEHAAPAAGGHRDRVHPARRALREHDPPDHDPLDAAVGGRRRAARADDLPHRLLGDRADRNHSPDRHRREERDHDDRLRARRRAQGEEAAARGDHAGGAPALPADPDDDAWPRSWRASRSRSDRASAPSCGGPSASRSSAG